jgi:hypothetical protein
VDSNVHDSSKGLEEASFFYVLMRNLLGRLSRHTSFLWRSTASRKTPMRVHLHGTDMALNSYHIHRDLSTADRGRKVIENLLLDSRTMTTVWISNANIRHWKYILAVG